MSKWVKYFGRKGLNFFNFFTVTYRRVLTPQSRALHEDILFLFNIFLPVVRSYLF